MVLVSARLMGGVPRLPPLREVRPNPTAKPDLVPNSARWPVTSVGPLQGRPGPNEAGARRSSDCPPHVRRDFVVQRRRPRRWIALLLFGASVAGCKERTLSSFIAFERDFQQFRAWQGGSFEELPARGQTHFAGEQRYFINGPARRGREFPVGTIIVKQARLAARPEGQLFAMVKRGGGFNAEGAVGWEWFELVERDDESVAIKWRGVSAPSGESYGNDPHGTCNVCHVEAKANDFVKSPALASR